MKYRNLVLWSLLGAGVAAGVVLVARQPDSKLRLKLDDAARSLKDWADPMVKDLVAAQSDAQGRVEAEMSALRAQLSAVEAAAKEQLDAVRNLKEQAQLGLYSAQYKAEGLRDQVKGSLHNAEVKAHALKDRVKEGYQAVHGELQAVHDAAVTFKDQALGGGRPAPENN